MKRTIFLLLTVSTAMAEGQVVVYDGSVMPEFDGWQREGTFDCDRSIEDGWFHQFCELGEWEEPIGETDVYRKSLAGFAGVEDFFVEWVVETDIPASILEVSGVGTNLTIGGNSPAFYHTTITDERVQLARSTSIPLVFVDIEPGVPHKYRIELTPSSFKWLIDDEVVHSGTPLAPFPTDASYLVWGSRHYLFDNNSGWDYVKYGVIEDRAIPAVSEWGVVSMMLLVVTAGTIIFRRHDIGSSSRATGR
jgi:hypothetical protein